MTNVNLKELAESIVESIYAQEAPENRVISQAYITSKNVLWIRSDCDGWAESIKKDTLWEGHGFNANDFIGLTEEEANKMISMNSIDYFFSGLAFDEIDDAVLPYL